MASLPLLGNDGELDLTFLDVEHRIRRIALRKNLLVRSIFGDGSAAIDGGEKYLRVKRDFSYFPWHRWCSEFGGGRRDRLYEHPATIRR